LAPIEVVIGLSPLSMVAMAVLVSFLRGGTQATSHPLRSQSADAVAMSAMEKVCSICA